MLEQTCRGLSSTRYKPRNAIACVAFVTVFLGESASAGAAVPPTIAQVLDGLERIEAGVFGSRAFVINYERIGSEGPSELLLAEYRSAFSGDKWFYEKRWTKPFRKPGVVNVPKEPSTHVVKGGLVLRWDQHTRSATLNSFEDGWNIHAGWDYTLHLGLDAPRFILSSNDASAKLTGVRKSFPDEADHPFLPAFLRENAADYRVGPQPEEVVGQSCWVLDFPGVDRICVDPTKNFAIVKRSYSWGPGKPARLSVENSDFKEVKPGLWLPFHQVVERYAVLTERKSLWGTVTSRSEYQLKSVAFDEGVSDALFDVELPVGTNVFDAVRNFNYRISGPSAEPFDALIKSAQTRDKKSLSYWLVIMNCVVFALLVGVALYRRWAK